LKVDKVNTPEEEKRNPGRFEDAGRRLDKELEEFIRWFNDDVVPSVRSRSGNALRKAAVKLSRMADQFEDAKPKDKENEKP
jgi:hypothetical protein